MQSDGCHPNLAGLVDPQLALLRVRIERAEYWDAPGKAAYLLAVAKASLTGKPAQVGERSWPPFEDLGNRCAQFGQIEGFA